MIIRRQIKQETRVSSLCGKLRDLAYARGPEGKLPTTREICAGYGASLNTLNAALAELESENIIYRKQGSGIYVSPKIHTKNIHVFINTSLIDQDCVSPFWGLLWGKMVQQKQMRATTKNESIHFQLVACGPDFAAPIPPEIAEVVENRSVDGILMVGMGIRMTSAIWSIPKSIPMVSFAGSGHWMVNLRNNLAIVGAVERLAALGCHRIGYWQPDYERAPEEHLASVEDTSTKTFRTALSECGLRDYPEMYRVGTGDVDIELKDFYEQGFIAASNLFAQPKSAWPDGLVITDDMMTFGAITALRKRGLQPGQHVKIASQSNIGSPVLYDWRDDLLLWRTDPSEIALMMFSQLDRLMGGEDVEQFVHVDQRFHN